ncbi:MAG: hypothetical protein ABIY50_07845 [Ignavibacteria bacterium]
MILQNHATSLLTKSIKAFTAHLIDYAGLFPPAKLTIDTALENYINYINGEDKWMISTFICPVKLLSELQIIFNKTYPLEKLINLSVLGRGGHSKDDFVKNFEEDLIYWKNINSDQSIKTNLFEIKLPDGLITSHDENDISDFIDYIFKKIDEEIAHPVFIFLEGHVGTEWKKNISALIEGIKIHNNKKKNCGFKFRTGGVEQYSFPTSEQIAFCIRECIDREIQIKFTAGLHHPFRHYDKEIDIIMHGFINVFGAGIISLRHNLSNAGLKNIISDDNPKNFIFTDEFFSWNDWKIPVEDIEFARKDLMISFGSCSFEEPLEDLRLANLL